MSAWRVPGNVANDAPKRERGARRIWRNLHLEPAVLIAVLILAAGLWSFLAPGAEKAPRPQPPG